MKSPELLAPAGTLQAMRHAFAFGADAVYAGQPRYSLRVRNNEFTLSALETGIREAHALHKKFLVAVNIYPHNHKLPSFLADLEPVIHMQPDALIMADPGLIMLVRERWPDMPIHLSVQANTVNYQAVRFWKSVGITRVILSRELSLEEVAEIRQRCPDIELEVFVHGALCIAYSGRCLLSGYFNHKDSNQGACTNACRWLYKLAPSSAGEMDRDPRADAAFDLEESERPGDRMSITEDEHGTYIMNSRDLRAIEHVQRLVEIGVDCLKIEGRTKSAYYAARTSQAYRTAIDAAVEGRPLDPSLLSALDALSNRGYTDGFYTRHRADDTQNYTHGTSLGRHQQFVAEATRVDCENGWIELHTKNRFAVGDKVDLVVPSGPIQTIVLDSIQTLEGEPLQSVAGSGFAVRIPLPTGIIDDLILVSRHLTT